MFHKKITYPSEDFSEELIVMEVVLALLTRLLQQTNWKQTYF